MDPRVSIITLGVADLERSYRFYSDGLGLPAGWGPDKGIVFFRTRGTCLALYPADKLDEDIGRTRPSEPGGPSITLAHNVETREEVDVVMTAAAAAGATVVKPAEEAFWGGYSGYFADPDGHLWEVACGAFPLDENGFLVIE